MVESIKMFLPYLIFVLHFTAYADETCFDAVERDVRHSSDASLNLDLDYYSEAGLKQRVIGPLRSNLLSSSDVDQVEKLLKNKNFEFYELASWHKPDEMRFDLLAVNRRTCRIIKRYRLL